MLVLVHLQLLNNVTVTTPDGSAKITATADNTTVTLDGTAKTVQITATVPSGPTGDVTFTAEAGKDNQHLAQGLQPIQVLFLELVLQEHQIQQQHKLQEQLL